MAGNLEFFQKTMNMGHSAAWDQQWDRAISYYRQALEEFPDHAMALTSLGLALFEMKDLTGALAIYQRAAAVTPSDPLPVEKVSRIHEQLGNNPDAVRTGMQAAELFLRNRDVDKAIENWLRVLSIQETLAARTRLALVYEKMGHKTDAISEYVAAASLLQHTGNVAKAMQVAEYALQIMPDNLDAQQAVTMLRTNQSLPRPPRPRQGFDKSVARPVIALEAPDPKTTTLDPISEARQQALVQLAAQLFDQAEDTGSSGQASRRGISSLARGESSGAQSSDQTRILLHLGQAIDSQSKGQEAQAAQELERALKIGLRSPAADFNLGLLYTGRDPQKALQHLREAVKHPDFALASFLLIAQAQQKLGNLKETTSALLNALRLADLQTVPQTQVEDLDQLYEPLIEATGREEDERILRANCQSITEQINRQGWRQYLMLARQQLPPQPEGSPPLPLAEILLETRNSQILEMLAHVRQLAAQNRMFAAMEEAYFALQQAPSYLPLHVQIGDLLLKEGRLQDALEKFTQVARLYSLRGEAAQAVRLYRRMIQIAPMDQNVRGQLIELLLAQGQSENAVKETINLAEIHSQMAEMDKARVTYIEGLRNVQKARLGKDLAVHILYRIADIDLQRLDWRNAVRDYEQIRSLDPEDGAARQQLVDMNFRMSLDHSAVAEIDSFVVLMESVNKHLQAVEFLQQIIEQHPDKFEVRKRLGELFQRHNQFSEAIEQFDAVADALLNAGDRAAAIAVVQQIIAMRPPNTAAYERVLQQLRTAR